MKWKRATPRNQAEYCFVMIMLSFMFVLGIPSHARGAAGCTEGITDYWKLDESSGTIFADSVGTDNASCTAPSCPGFVAGRISNALQFDGVDDGIDAPAAASFDWGSNDSFSIEFWMKTDSASTCSGGQVIAGRTDSATGLQWWVGCKNGGSPAFVLIDKNGNSAILAGSTDLTDGLWHHIVAVRDAGTNEVRLYVDKVKEASADQSFTGGFDSATATLSIGWLNLDSGYHFAGTIDEIALYNKVLPEQIITQHYYDGSVGLRLGYCGCSSAVRIMPLGDSITLGRNDPALETNGTYEPPSNYITGYRKPLYWALQNAGYFVDFVGGRKSGSLATPFFDVDHQGELSETGFTAQDMANDVYNFLTANPAAVVLLHIGTNNVDSPPYDTSTGTLSTVLDQICSYNSDITVILALIINTKTAGTDAHNAITQYNQNVRTMAMDRIAAGDKIIIVDQENALIYPDDLYDEWHPTSSGYNKMANVWMNALTTFLPVCIQVAPTITTTPVPTVIAGKPYQYDVKATGNPAPSYNLLPGYPAGMTIDSTTGLIQWTPTAAGDVNVTVEASNGIDPKADQSFTINVVEPPPCPSGMIHYWKLDETGGTPYKDLYGINDATCVNCPTATTGIIGGARQFGATNQVDVADDNTFDWGAADSFSIEFWMKTDSASTCSGGQVIMGRDDSASQLHWWVGCQGTTGVATFVLIDKNGTSAILTGSTDLTDGLWHHIVAVRDAGTNEVRLYVDNVKEASAVQSYTSGFDSASAALNIGWLNLDAGYHFVGTVDEVALYDKPLSDTEILQHYTYGIDGVGYCELIAPTIVSSAVTNGITGVPYTYGVTAMGNPVPTYSLITYPPGMTINSTTGLIQWTPVATGDFAVTVRASNGFGTPADQGFSIHVDASVAPAITTTPVTSVYAGKPYQYDVDATGNPVPTYSLITYPPGMTINSATGLIQWTPAVPGDVNVKVRASNGIGTPAEQTFTISVVAVPPLPVGMIHYWKLDETGGTPYKDLYGINDATCVNCPTATTGIIGGAQQFAATNQVDVADDNTFDWGAADSFSIEFWMKTDSASTCSGGQVIAGRVDSATTLQWWVGCKNGGAPAFVLIDKNGNSAILNGSTDITDGNWHHMVAVRDAVTNEVRLYVDGVKEVSVVQSFSGGFDSATAALNIGWLNLDAGYHFVGTVDEVALYDKPLSNTEILQHYTNGQSGQGYSYGLSVKRIGLTTEYYSALQAAYDAASDGDIIQSEALSFNESLLFDHDIQVTIEGGYDSNFSSPPTGYTTVVTTTEPLTISEGTVVVNRLVLK